MRGPPGIGERPGRHGGADIQIPTQPLDAGEIEGIGFGGFGAVKISRDRQVIRHQQIDRQAKHAPVRFEYQMPGAGEPVCHRSEKSAIETARRFDSEGVGYILAFFIDRYRSTDGIDRPVKLVLVKRYPVDFCR